MYPPCFWGRLDRHVWLQTPLPPLLPAGLSPLKSAPIVWWLLVCRGSFSQALCPIFFLEVTCVGQSVPQKGQNFLEEAKLMSELSFTRITPPSLGLYDVVWYFSTKAGWHCQKNDFGILGPTPIYSKNVTLNFYPIWAQVRPFGRKVYGAVKNKQTLLFLMDHFGSAQRRGVANCPSPPTCQPGNSRSPTKWGY